MSARGKWTLKYGLSAVLLAIGIIFVSLIANPAMLPTPNQPTPSSEPTQTNPPSQPGQTHPLASLAVMLTDPPTVPAGTTVLNLTYTNVTLHVAYPNGTAEWLPTNASGTVNLFSLVNVTQTLANVTVPLTSTVNMIKFTIADVQATINNATYNVTALSDTLIVKVEDGLVNETLSGVLLDFNPTLVQIQATDENETLVNYYVLVPSATALVINELSEDQLIVGTIVRIKEKNRIRLITVEEHLQKSVTISKALLSVKDDVTKLLVTLKNEGGLPFRVFGLTLHGDFDATQTWKNGEHGKGKHGKSGETIEGIHPRTIPFKISGSSLVPVFGTDDEDIEEHGYKDFSSLVIQPGNSVDLSFEGVITVQWGNKHKTWPTIVLAPLVGEDYTLRLMGEGFQTLEVTATATT